VTFTAQVDNAAGGTWTWTILDPATGATLHQVSSPGSMTYTLPAGSPASLRIRLELATAAGAATPVTMPFTTTSSLAPQITSLTCDNLTPDVGQPVSCSATEPVAGARATWTWDVVNTDTNSTVVPATTRPAGQDFVFTFQTAAHYRVRLVVDYDGASSERTLDIIVVPLFDLTVTLIGTGSGTVTGNGLTCAGTTCTGRYRPGTAVQLTATATAADSIFEGWGMVACAVNGPCVVSIDQARNVTADFSGPPLAALRAIDNGSALPPYRPLDMLLDASGSRPSTLRTPIVAYRFDFGDGGGTGWQTNPRATHSYGPGAQKFTTYHPVVFVRDSVGRVGTATASVTVVCC